MSGIQEALLVLADGTTFEGEAIGAEPDDGVATGEVVFNTVLSGYQEVITDPSYAGQMIAFTYPHIGNYGVTPEDDESARPFCRGVIIRELARRRSNWRAEDDLDAFLTRHGVPGIAGIDTRRLTRHIRDAGSMPGAFGTADETTLKQAALDEPGTDGQDLATVVSCTEPYTVGDGPRRVVAYDLGMKTTILRHLSGLATVEVVPAGDHRRRGPGPRARRGVPLQRPRRPRRGHHHHRGHPGPARRGPGLRHLPRTPAAGHRPRRRHREAALRPPRGEPPGPAPGHRRHRDHQPEPQLRRRRRLARGGRGHPREPQRRRHRRAAQQRRARLQRPVPPGGRARTARRPLPVRPLRRPHGRSTDAQAGRHRVDPAHRRRTDRHRPGL